MINETLSSVFDAMPGDGGAASEIDTTPPHLKPFENRRFFRQRRPEERPSLRISVTPVQSSAHMGEGGCPLPHQIAFDRPSMRYDEGLPLGNGRLGAMVLGGVREKFIHLNEETAWYGGPRDRVNPDAAARMPEIRRLMREGRVREAERLAVLALTGTPESQRHFTTLGLIVLDFFDHDDARAAAYSHTLDFHTATATQAYVLGGAQYRMETFVSMPHRVVAIRISADAPVLNFFAGVERGERVGQFSYGTHEDTARRIGGGVLIEGNLGGRKGLDFAVAIAGRSDGEYSLIGDKLSVKNAHVAEFYIAGGTNYEGGDPAADCEARLAAALGAGYDAVRAAHLQAWSPLYDLAEVRVTGAGALPPMNRLFDALKSGVSPEEALGLSLRELDDRLSLLLFHFGRYALFSAGHHSLLPAALQGLWCRDLLSIWDGKYTTNINLQMNYWPVDSANLPGCFDGYFRLAQRIRESGTDTARRMYGCRGFVLHNNTDLWADTAVQDAGTHCSYWFSGGFWVAADLWEHYLYTRDKAYLLRAWPVIRDAALFALDFLEEDEAGRLVMGVTSSPENSYLDAEGRRVSFCRMTAMDSQLIALNFSNCLEALRLMPDAPCPAGFAQRLLDARARLYPTQVGADGAVLEWGEAHPEVEPSHRHQSHLIGAYPYGLITARTPELFRAVEAALDKRRRAGGCNTGWSRAWAGGLYARLGRGDDARDMVGGMARLSGQPNLFSCCNIGRVPKLMEDAMPMQIDGNLGAVQAVVEMLLASHDGEIRLLPALPESWKDGEFRGLVARGNVEIDARWQGGALTWARLSPRVDGEIRLAGMAGFALSGADARTADGEGVIAFAAKAGQTYQIARGNACSGM